MNEMHQLRVEFRNRWHVLISEGDFKETDNQVMNNIDDCVRSAEIVVSVASSIVHSRSTVLAHSQRASDIGQRPGDRTRLWVERIYELTLREDQTGENVATSSVTSTTILPPPTPSHTSVASTIAMSPPTPDLASVGGRYAESDITATGVQTPTDTESDFFVEAELALIENSFNIGKKHLDKGNYKEACEYIEKAWDRATTVKPEAREQYMRPLMTCYSITNQWDKAEKMLLELHDNTRGTSQKEIEHAIAETYLNKSDLDRAEKWCRAAIQGKRRALRTREHESIYESVFLLAQILQNKGLRIDAEVYKSLIPPENLRICPFGLHTDSSAIGDPSDAI